MATWALVLLAIQDRTFGRVVGHAEAEYAEDLVVVGDFAYVCGKSNGLYTFRIADPANPALVRTIETVNAWDVAASAGRLYLADYEGGLRIFDIASDPADPRPIAQYTPGWTVIQVAVDEAAHRAYLSGANSGTARVEVLDVSLPEDPHRLGACDGPFAETRSISSLAFKGRYLYAGGAEGTLHVLDVGEPARPSIIGRYRNQGPLGGGAWCLGIFVDGDTLYLSDWGAGVVLLDISNPGALRELSTFTVRGYHFYDAWASGDRAYLASNLGLSVLDVSDRANPRLVRDHISCKVELEDMLHGVWVVPDRGLAYIADNGEQMLTVVSVAER